MSLQILQIILQSFPGILATVLQIIAAAEAKHPGTTMALANAFQEHSPALSAAMQVAVTPKV